MWANSFLFALPQLFIIHQRSGFIIQYSFVPTHHPEGIVPKATFAGERSSPLLANAPLSDTVLKAAFAKSPPCLKGG